MFDNKGINYIKFLGFHWKWNYLFFLYLNSVSNILHSDRKSILKQTSISSPYMSHGHGWRYSLQFFLERTQHSIHSPYSHNFSERHLHLSQLCNKYSRHCFIESRSIHVDSSPDGNHKARDTRIQTHFVAAAYCYRHRSWAGIIRYILHIYCWTSSTIATYSVFLLTEKSNQRANIITQNNEI